MKTAYERASRKAADFEADQDRVTFVWTSNHPGCLGIVEEYDLPWMTLVYAEEEEVSDGREVQVVCLSDLSTMKALRGALDRTISEHEERERVKRWEKQVGK